MAWHGGLLFRARFPRPTKAAHKAALLLALGLFDAGQALTQLGQLCGLAGNLGGLLTQPGGLVCKLAGLAVYDALLLRQDHEGLPGLALALVGLFRLFWRRLFRFFIWRDDGKLAVDLLPSHAGLQHALGAAERGNIGLCERPTLAGLRGSLCG